MYNNNNSQSSNNSTEADMSFPLTIKQGTYDLVSSTTFFIDNVKLVIRKRKAGKNKTVNFLSAFLGKQHCYVSSLFPVSNNDSLYKFDDKINIYTLKINETTVQISTVNN